MSETPRLSGVLAGLRAPRSVHGISAVLLPYTAGGVIDWPSFERHLARTAAAGLDPALNMDTGFGDLLTEDERRALLDAARGVLGPGRRFYAAAFAGDADPVADYRDTAAAIVQRGGIPVLVQCRAMHGLTAAARADLYRHAVAGLDQALAFELSPVFAPHGELWDDETFERLLDIPQLVGAKHSSLDRVLEWRRLAARDARRPEWRVYTGNDLAIDMVLYGSDYLLGLSTFAPEVFAARDRALAGDDVAFLLLNDGLQHLGNVAFRAPVPAYKHAAAQFLYLTGGLPCDAVHPAGPRRPDSERVVLADCARRLGLPVVVPVDG